MTFENLRQGTLVAEHGKIVDEIANVKDLVEPCFPPHYHIFELFVDRYHALLVELVRVIMDVRVCDSYPPHTHSKNHTQTHTGARDNGRVCV